MKFIGFLLKVIGGLTVVTVVKDEIDKKIDRTVEKRLKEREA